MRVWPHRRFGSRQDTAARGAGPASCKPVATCAFSRERRLAQLRAAGQALRAKVMQHFRALFTQRVSTVTASMLRDLEGGGRTEGAHAGA